MVKVNGKRLPYSRVVGGALAATLATAGIAVPSVPAFAEAGLVETQAVEEGDVVSIGEEGYASIAEAVKAAPNGVETTIKLLNDLDGISQVTIPVNKTIILDLNGHNITAASDDDGSIKHQYVFSNRGKLTVKDSAGSGVISGRGVANEADATMSIEGGTIQAIDGNGGAAVDNDGTLYMSGGTLEAIQEPMGSSPAAALINTSNAYLSGGSLKSVTWCISNAGSLDAENVHIESNHLPNPSATWNCIKTIGSSTTYLTEVTIVANGNGGIEAAGGTVTMDDCTVTQSGGADPRPWNAMCVAASQGGTLTVNGGSYTSYNGWGAYVFNSGGTININGGKFSATHAVQCDADDGVESFINITGGDFVGDFVASGNGSNHIVVRGGKFNSDTVESFLVPGLAYDETTGMVAPAADTVAQLTIDDRVIGYYETLQEAVAAADTYKDAVITLREDATGPGVVVSSKQDITFDFGGHTYTVNDPVGSSGTETNGFQLHKGSDVTLRNGTIAASPSSSGPVKILIQNYSNLTLEGVTLDGRGLADYDQANYTLSNNNGEITVGSGAVIISNEGEGNIAMDVCWAASYMDGAHVTVEVGAEIRGDVELGLWGNNSYAGSQSALTVNGGTITGDLIIQATNPATTPEGIASNVKINGGTFGSVVDGFINKDDKAKAKVQSDGKYSYFTSEDAALGAAQPGDIVSAVDSRAEIVFVTLKYADSSTSDTVIRTPVRSKVILPAASRPGYSFRGWSDGSKTFAAGTAYVVLEDGAVLTASWSSNYVPPVQTGEKVDVEQTAGGTVTVSPTRADKGDTVTVTAKPDTGKLAWSVTVEDADGTAVDTKPGEKDGTWTFVMPGSEVSVSVRFVCDGKTDCPSSVLSDVEVGAWYHDIVDWAVENGIMTGYEGVGLFGPDDALTRAQLATVLYREAGSPKVESRVQFTDTAPGAWYEDAIAWADAEGIMTGYGNGMFGPDDVLTREQLATVFWRLAGEVEVDASLDEFIDGDDTSPWAIAAVKWAVSTGLLQGYDDTDVLDPNGDLTRAQMATVMYRRSEGK